MSMASAISSPVSTRTHYYATPFSNAEQRLKQVALYVLAALAACAAVALVTATIAGAVTVLAGSLGTPVALLVAGILFYVARTHPFFHVTPGQIVRGPFGGDYEKDFMTALNQGMVDTTTQNAIQHRKDHPFFPKIQHRYDQFIDCLQEDPPEKPLIPKKIHLIWIGPKPVSKETQAVVNSWKTLHPDWECQLWGNKEAEEVIAKMSAFPKVKETWDAAPSWSEKSDVLRYSILYLHGGFYADTDLPCVGLIDDLHYFSDFYCGLQDVRESSCKTRFLPPMVCNSAAVGSAPGHPILEEMFRRFQPCTDQGKYSDGALWRAGPVLLSQAVREFSIKEKADKARAPLVLPPVYFYPAPVCRSKLLVIDKGYIPFEQSYPYLTPVSKAVHLWEGSWVKYSCADVKKALTRFFCNR